MKRRKNPYDKKKVVALAKLIANYFQEKRRSKITNKKISAILKLYHNKKLKGLKSHNKKFSVHISESGRNTNTTTIICTVFTFNNKYADKI